MGTTAATVAGRRRATARKPRNRPAPRAASRRTPRRPPARRAGRARAPASRWPRLRSLRRRALIVAAIAGVGAIAYFAWFRDSSLVAVQSVKVEGAASSDRGKIVGALTHAARQMTTLHVQTNRLESAVSGLPTVASVSADASFPHGLTIHVTEREPVLVATEGDQRVAVAADGSVLPGIKVSGDLPELPVDSVPGSGRLSGTALAEALTIGAAPPELRSLIDDATVTRDYGVVVTIRGGIQLRFGTGGNREGKWAAAAAVLADPALSSLTYVDVRVPGRPAVGGTSDPSPATTPVTASPTTVTATP